MSTTAKNGHLGKRVGVHQSSSSDFTRRPRVSPLSTSVFRCVLYEMLGSSFLPYIRVSVRDHEGKPTNKVMLAPICPPELVETLSLKTKAIVKRSDAERLLSMA